MTNPLFSNNGLPPFEMIKPSHVVPAVTQVIEDNLKKLKLVDQVQESPTWETVMQPVEDILYSLHLVWHPVTHLMGVKSSSELRDAQETAQSKVVDFELRLAQSEGLAENLTKLKSSLEWDNLTLAQKRIVDLRLLNARQSGINLKGKERDRFNDISKQLSRLETKFSNNLLDATKSFHMIIESPSSLEGVPHNYLELWSSRYAEKFPDRDTSADVGPWLITLDAPSYGPFMKLSPDREKRRELFHAYATRASSGELDNSGLILETLSLRQELSHLVGYDSFAELILSGRMAKKVDQVEHLLRDLKTHFYPAAEKELAAIKTHAKELGLTDSLQPWDLNYYKEKVKNFQLNFSEEELRPFFPFKKVLQGLIEHCESLFSIDIKKRRQQPEVWDQAVEYYDIYDENGTLIAGFYLDPYARPASKRGGAWMDDCASKLYFRGQEQIPIAYLVCNSSMPVADKPALLSFREVQTLFHEFGHGLQHMLTEISFLEASGINGIEWDAVELPSQFMENWCLQADVLESISEHYETKATLPKELVDKLIHSKNFDTGLMTCRQLHFAMIDIDLHKSRDNSRHTDVFARSLELAKVASPAPVYDQDRFLCSFSHVFAGGYASGYYSYKWAEVLSADAFGRFEEEGLGKLETIKKVGRAFRSTIMAKGGSADPMAIFQEFRGRPPKIDALLRHNGLES